MKRYLHFLSLAGLLLFAAACSDDNSNEIEIPNLMKIGEFTDAGITVVAYSEGELAVGYNNLYLEVHQNGTRYDNATVQFTTMMHMESHSHASPLGLPEQIRERTHNLYKAWAIFTMPSGMMGRWELQFTVKNANQSETIASGIIPIQVAQANRVSTFMAEDGTRYILTLVNPMAPKVGMNDLEVTLHRSESMMSFPAVSNATMVFEPWMPSMGHGSSNNVSPAHQSNGFYKGKVNFNMTGDWELRFDMTINGAPMSRRTFALEF